MWKGVSDLRAAEAANIITPDLLAESYARCRTFSVSAELAALHDRLGEGELKDLLQAHTRLLSYGRLVIAEALRDLAGHDLFLLTSPEGRLLELWADPAILAQASEHGLRPGTSLAESSAGTNAVAMALNLKVAVALRGEQHLCRLFWDWSCAASPIFDRDGELVGCVDISAGNGPLHEKLALARSISRELGRLMGGSPRRLPFAVTSRQRQVLDLFAQGASYKEIARHLDISIKTVEEHLDAVRNKMGTKSRRACIRKAVELGLL
ncbi:MAG: LuxR C-terminal-related transcriptional regulator [Gammaproteobacteria bacterium]|nr:LuxR C-terminal-related transcriptional regulator [Gammaproteobacteria bacterium]